MAKRILRSLIWLLGFISVLLSFSSCTPLQQAAEQGNARAQYKLAHKYENGDGLPQNYAEAFKWYKKAAEQGNTDAQLCLAYMYCNGKGTAKNYIEGYVWLSIASAQGDKEAKYQLSILEVEMSSEQLAEAQQKAALLWEKIHKTKK